MEHLFCPEHGGVVLTALSSVFLWKTCPWPKRYRVVHQKVSGGQVKEIVYGPYRWFWVAFTVAHWVCGEWDAATIETRK